MEQKEFSAKESLSLINEMISGARARMSENGFIYLFWGWLILVAALAQFIMLNTGLGAYNYYPYLLAIPGAIYTAVYESRGKRKNQQADYTGTIMAAVWITAGLNMLIAGFVFAPVLQMSPVSFILIILGLATVISGAVIRFRPLIWGGIISNLAGIAAVFIGYAWHPVLVIAAILAADLIPGYMLRRKYNTYYAEKA